MKKVLLGVLLFIIIAGVGIYVTLNTSTKVDVTYNTTDFNSALKKTSIVIDDIKEINLITLAQKDFVVSGTNTVDISFSNEEMSALIDMANQSGGPISDFKVAFLGNNEGELSFKITDQFLNFIKEENMIYVPTSTFSAISNSYLFASTSNSITDTVVNFITNIAANKPVYAKGTLTKTSEHSITVHISSLKVGQIPLSNDVISKVESEVVKFVNALLSESNGFSIEELRIENGAIYYKGTLPSEIKGKKIID
jgi:hypothetical protein